MDNGEARPARRCAPRPRSQQLETVGKELRALDAPGRGALEPVAVGRRSRSAPRLRHRRRRRPPAARGVRRDEIERATGHRLRVARALVRDPAQGAGVRARRRACSRTTSATILDDPSIQVVAEVMGGVDPAGDHVLDAAPLGPPGRDGEQAARRPPRRRALRGGRRGRRAAALRGVCLRRDPGDQGAARVARRHERPPRARDRQRDDELHPLGDGGGPLVRRRARRGAAARLRRGRPDRGRRRARRRGEDGDPRHRRVRLARPARLGRGRGHRARHARTTSRPPARSTCT